MVPGTFFRTLVVVVAMCQHSTAGSIAVCRASINCSAICDQWKVRNELRELSKGTVPNASFERRPWWRTCAIVGSSGSLLGQGLGTMIDKYDAIFRMNGAPHQGFQADVGNRTTVRVGNKNLTGDELLVKKLRGTTCEERHRRLLPGKHIPKIIASDLKATVCLRYGAPFQLPDNAHKVTTGMLAAALALELCGYVSFFGFDSHDDYLNMSDAIIHDITTPTKHKSYANIIHPYHYFDRRHPAHPDRLPKLDSTLHQVLNSTHDIATEAQWRSTFLNSDACTSAASGSAFFALLENLSSTFSSPSSLPPSPAVRGRRPVSSATAATGAQRSFSPREDDDDGPASFLSDLFSWVVRKKRSSSSSS